MVDEETIAWAFRLILGRECDDPQVLAHIAAHAESLEHVRRSFFQSPEYESRMGYGIHFPGRFEARTESGPRIVIIGNCQGPELARYLAAMTGASVLGLDATTYATDSSGRWSEDCTQADYILSMQFPEQFEGIGLRHLHERFPGKVITLCPVEFRGLYPDVLRLGEPHAPVNGPMATHSGLVLCGFLTGLDEAACLRLFRSETFEAFGYYAAWDRSRAEFYKREEFVDIKIAHEFFDRVRTEPLMLTDNYPATILYQMICERICSRLDQPFRRIPVGIGSGIQAHPAVWPVYDEIAAHHGLTYRTSRMFVRDWAAFDLRSFVRSSYSAYRELGASKILEALSACDPGEREAHPWIESILAGEPLRLPSAAPEPARAPDRKPTHANEGSGGDHDPASAPPSTAEAAHGADEPAQANEPPKAAHQAPPRRGWKPFWRR